LLRIAPWNNSWSIVILNQIREISTAANRDIIKKFHTAENKAQPKQTKNVFPLFFPQKNPSQQFPRKINKLIKI
jgi:hypothetical protein